MMSLFSCNFLQFDSFVHFGLNLPIFSNTGQWKRCQQKLTATQRLPYISVATNGTVEYQFDTFDILIFKGFVLSLD